MTVPEKEIQHIGGVEVRPSTPEERKEYLQELNTVVGHLRELAGGEEGWWIVGGMARDAYLENNEFVTKDPQGKWRDVDILFSSSNTNLARQLRKKYDGPLPIHGTGLQHFVEIPDGIDRDAFLTFGGLRVRVPGKVFESNNVQLGNVSFPTVPENTLLHLYAVGDRPGGKMRIKDFVNALHLARHIRDNPNEDFPEEMYVGFHKFARRKNKPGRKSLTAFAREMARRYKETGLNKHLPINTGITGEIAEKVYDIVQLAERLDPIHD